MVTTAGVFPFRTTPISNVTPFTYRDGITYLEILEKLVSYVEKELPGYLTGETNRIVESFNTTVESLNATVAENESDMQAFIDAFVLEINATVATINDRVGPEGIQRITLIADHVLTVQTAWPTAHPIMVQITQDATGGHALTLEPRITGPVVIDQAPGAVSTFYLVPYGVDVWRVSQTIVDALKVAEPIITPGEPTQVWAGDKTWTTLTKALVGLGDVNNTRDADKPVSGPLEARFRHRLYTKWDKPLDRWADALMNMDTAPVVWVNAGSSTANGGVTERASQAWFNRVCHLMGQTAGQADLSTASSTTVPVNGFYGVKAAVGGTTSANYLTASDVTKINSLSPDLVSHMIGSNDWSTNVPLSTYKANVRNNVQAIRSANPQTTQLLIHQQGRLDGTRQLPWSAYGRALREVAEEFPDSCVFLDLDQHFRFMGIPAGNTWGFVVSDNLHLNAAGNLTLADIVCEYLGLPTTKMLGKEVYETLTFNGGLMTTANDGKIIASITVPPKPYIRNMVVNALAFAYTSSGYNDILINPRAELSTGRNVAARIENRAPGLSYGWSAHYAIEPYSSGAVEMMASIYSGPDLYVTNQNGFASFVAELTPGF